MEQEFIHSVMRGFMRKGVWGVFRAAAAADAADASVEVVAGGAQGG